jgi:hypothetical protein
MSQRPAHTPLPQDIWNPDFAALNAAWAKQFCSEIEDRVACTRKRIDESKVLIRKLDRMLEVK